MSQKMFKSISKHFEVAVVNLEHFEIFLGIKFVDFMLF